MFIKFEGMKAVRNSTPNLFNYYLFIKSLTQLNDTLTDKHVLQI